MTKNIVTVKSALSAEGVKTPAQQSKAIKDLIAKLEVERTAALESKSASAAKYARHRLRVAKARLEALTAEKEKVTKAKPAKETTPVVA